MHLPPPSPAVRGPLLRLLATLVAFVPVRDLVLARLRRDTGIDRLPEV